ncbi:MAG: NB-ARC domain-containing protein [Chloroflexota bacterium]
MRNDQVISPEANLEENLEHTSVLNAVMEGAGDFLDEHNIGGIEPDLNTGHEDMVKSVTLALRAYRRAKSKIPKSFTDLTLVSQLLQSGAAPSGKQALRWATKKVLEEEVALFRPMNPDAADLLVHRFFQGQSVIATARSLGLSESSIYYRQKQAIRLLTDRLLTRENQAQEALNQNVHSRRRHLPPKTYTQLFGLDGKLETLCNTLSAPNEPWVISIVGMGGMGKTTLAHAGAEWSADHGIFSYVIWLTAKQEEYNTWRGERQDLPTSPFSDISQGDAVETNAGQLPLTYEKFLDTIAIQLGLNEVARGTSLSPPLITDMADETPKANMESEISTASLSNGSGEASNDTGSNALGLSPAVQHKQDALRTFLSDNPALIVIDNLETTLDYNDLILKSRYLTQPSKVLITSRYTVELPSIFLMRMDDLNFSDSVDLLRYEAEQRGLREIVDAPVDTLNAIYDVVGGNPLALKLVVGQLTSLPLAEVLERLKNAHKSRDQAEYELYYYLYWQIWHLLSPLAREVILAMPVFPIQGATWDDLLEVTGLSREELGTALPELISYSLLNAGGWPDKLYTIHRLTHTFLMTEVLKWW